MFDPGLWLAFAARIGDQFITLMTGGVIIVALALLERWLGKPVTQKTFAVFGVLVLIVACFQVWREEYIKNIGTLHVSFDVSDSYHIQEKTVDTQIILV